MKHGVFAPLTEDSWDKAAHRLVFPAQLAEAFCHDLVDAVTLHELPETLDCSRSQAESLYRFGAIKPVVVRNIGQGLHKLAFSRQEIQSFLDFLASIPVETREFPETANLTTATKRTGRGTGDLLARIRAGDLSARRQPGQIGLSNLRVNVADLQSLKILVGAAASG